MIQKSNNVEFFLSESSFGGDSRYSDQFPEWDSSIPQEIDNIFACLHKQLFPFESQVNKQNVQVLANRARILFNQSIPEQIRIIKKNFQTSQSKRNQVIFTQSSNTLQRFLLDYDDYKKQYLPYKEFYNKYGRDGNQDFRKKDYAQTYFEMQPDKVQIVEQKALGPGLQNSYSLPNSANNGSAEQASQAKEILQLREEIKRILRREKKLKKQYQIALSNEKIQNDIRVNRLFQLRWKDKAPSSNQQLSILQKQLSECQQKLVNQQQISQQLRIKLDHYEQIIDEKEFQNKKLTNQLESQRKLTNSRFSQQSQGGQSYKSDYDAPNSDIKKLQKMIKNLTNENHLLKKELNKLREINYTIKKGNANDLEAELQVSKKAFEKLQSDYRKIQTNCDNLTVENLKLKENEKFFQKVLDQLKKENIDIRDQMKEIKENDEIYYERQPIIRENYQSKSSLPQILSYEGDGLQGLPYYDILSRQYKVRFRRSCLKQKQLLYKHSGIEIGVITQLVQSNEIKLILHITNYTEKPIKNIRLKTLNPNENKINLEINKIDMLQPEQQKKILVYCVIRFYPIGPVIIAIQFENFSGKTQQARILLPAHILKMMQYKKRTQTIKRGKNKIIKFDQKIVKDFSSLTNYFKNISPTGSNKLEIQAKHSHSQTIIFLDIEKNAQQLEITYQTFDGSQKITQYFIKTLVFLLAR